MQAVPLQSRCRTCGLLLKCEPAATAIDRDQRDQRKEDGRRDGNAAGERQHSEIDRALPHRRECLGNGRGDAGTAPTMNREDKRPSRPPAVERIVASASRSCTRRARLEPSAVRTAISRVRDAALLRTSVATLAHVTRSTRPTAANSSNSGRSIRPAISSRRGAADSPIEKPARCSMGGRLAVIRGAKTSSSARASPIDTLSLSLPITL